MMCWPIFVGRPNGRSGRPILTKWRCSGVRVPRAAHLHGAGGGAAVALLVLLAVGGGLLHGSIPSLAATSHRTPVPKNFWQQAVGLGGGVYVRIFPRETGQRSCIIPIGKPAPHGPRTVRGTCSTEVVNRKGYLSLLTGSGDGPFWNRAGVIASGAVVLTQYWPGPWFQTNVVRWIFPVDAHGSVMGMEYVGTPPQFKK